MTFAIGTTVQLISGGPVMAVKSLGANSRVYCQWFAGKKLEQGEFPIASLKVVPPPTPPAAATATQP
jgi:uncharacterized protein YodC (DUF2158 family)